jgi:glutaredoxin
MAKIQILTTPGCSACAKVERILDKMHVKYEIIDITKNPEILTKYPVMSAPGIVINGKLEFTGGASEKELKKKLDESK